MKFDELYIVGGNNIKIVNQIDRNSKIIFLDEEHKKFDHSYSLIKNFNINQTFLRKKLLQFQEYIFLKKIKPLIKKNKKFEYILSSFFFESSPYKTDFVYKFFKLYLIIKYITKHKVKRIYLINVSDDICKFFYENSRKLSISIKVKKIKIFFFNFRDLLKTNTIISILPPTASTIAFS